MKRQATDWEEICANHTSDKELVSRICKILPKLIKKTKYKFNYKLQMGKKFGKDTSLKKMYRWQTADENMLNIINHYENENGNCLQMT